MANSKNYGLICGVNDVEILDLDFKVLETEEEKDNLYNETLLFIEENIKDASNKLALYETISGGYHLLYKTKKKEGNQVLAKIKIDKTKSKAWFSIASMVLLVGVYLLSVG